MSRIEPKRLRIILITAGCDRSAVGESWVAFEWASRIAELHDVTLLTYRASQKPPVAEDLPGVEVVEWTDVRLFERWERFNALLKPGYAAFYYRTRNWIKNRLRSGETIHLIHQITPNALRYPSPAVGLGVPYLVGPRGGCLETPKGFDADFGKVPWYTQLRKTDGWRLRHDPILRRTYRQARGVIAMAPYVKDSLGDLPPQVEVELMPDVGVERLPRLQILDRSGRRGIRLLFVGRVIRSKGVRDAIRAVSQLRDIHGLTLDVVGDGDDMGVCRTEVDQLGLNDIVAFHGRKPRGEVDAFYANSDVFLFPSFREPSGGVVVEAMSYGLPMIVADRGGPGFMVDDTCGFRVPVTVPEQYASDIAGRIRMLAESPTLRRSMGDCAREKVKREFLWEAKINRISELYWRVLSRSQSSQEVERKDPILAG